jgi:hypothetical protein
MILTGFQKKVVQDIIDGKVKDLESLISLNAKLSSAINDTNTTFTLYDRHTIIPQQKVSRVADDNEALSQVRQFVALWNQLEKANLLITITVEYHAPMPICRQDGTPHYKIIQIMALYNKRELIPFPELSDFIKNDFQTAEELKSYDEARDRKESLRLTRKVAYITIGISIVLSLLSVLFNYMTYTTARSVTITNAHAFSDTTKVLMIEPSTSTTSTESVKGSRK